VGLAGDFEQGVADGIGLGKGIQGQVVLAEIGLGLGLQPGPLVGWGRV